jgi:hypothetical protein
MPIDGELLRIKSQMLTLNLMTNQGKVQWGKKEEHDEGYEVGGGGVAKPAAVQDLRLKMKWKSYTRFVGLRLLPSPPLLVCCHATCYFQWLCTPLQRRKQALNCQRFSRNFKPFLKLYGIASSYNVKVTEDEQFHGKTVNLSPIQWVPGDLFLGVKRPGREADHSSPSSVKVKECMELYLHSPNTSSWRA